MPRSIAGHGRFRTRYPPPPKGTEVPSPSDTSASTPGNGNVAEPGLVVVTPGSGVIMIWPVSVCHHVSTIGALPPPMCSRYQSHASGLIGSPTEPSTRSDDRSCLPGCSDPCFMNARIAVGAQYRTVTLYSSMIDHQRSHPGVSGEPSYRRPVVALARGP